MERTEIKAMCMDIVVYLDKSVQLSVKKVSLSDVCISHVTRLEILIRENFFFTLISVVIAIIYKDLAILSGCRSYL